MSMGDHRWQAIAPSNFDWEREALVWLRAHLPDRDPWQAWTNFEFIDDEGKVNEVDALVLSPAGLFLVEIKSRPGVLTGDTHTWTWAQDSREYTYDNPRLLANRKAKRLASLLRRQPGVAKAKIKVPYVAELIFLSSTSLKCKLQGLARSAVFQRGRPDSSEDDGIVTALKNGLGALPEVTVDIQQARAIARALREAGIRPSNKHRQVGDWRLVALLDEGEGYQDWDAQHVSLGNVHRRVRIYTVASATTPEARANRVRQARREFEVLEGIDHAGILKVFQYTDTESGPALVFDHDPQVQRLDHFLRDHGAQLAVHQRLQLVRDIGETLQYAHARRLHHRALRPASILVHEGDGGVLRPRLMNWQTAARNVGASAATDASHRTSGTRHVEDYVEDPGRVYLAPETYHAEAAHGPSLDVFSLGAIAYHIMSGEPPATSAPELDQKLRAGPGLQISSVLDGCGPKLQELIQFSTMPEVLVRYESVKDFLAQLEAVEDELTAPTPEVTVDPSVATAGDRLEGGFTVLSRPGKGSSSDVLLVQEDGSDEELVLKVACDLAHNERLRDEGEVLAQLRHAHVVEYRRALTVAGRTALLMRRAGEHTLAEQLTPGRLSLDLLQRFGEELIEVVAFLEDQGVPHRDLKPENIGVAKNRNGKLQLVLFDFSLSRVPADNISAGTIPYRDPFLGQRKPPRWDLYAERYALALTLYQMAVGALPRWGDGVTAPAMLDCEVSIDSEVFDPVTREAFTAFFTRALRREPTERFHNAEEMLHAWRSLFQRRPGSRDVEPGTFDALAHTANAGTTMAELGYSLEAQDVLERMGVHNARELLAVERIKFRYLRGVGDKIRREIRLNAKRLAQLRPDLLGGRPNVHEGDESDAGNSIDALAHLLLPRRPAGDERPEEDAVGHYLGLDLGQEGAAPAGQWPTLGEAAALHAITRPVLTGALIKARERWLKTPAFTELREQIRSLLAQHNEVMTAHELAQALLTLRGCAQQDADDRLRLAMGVLRGACEAESHLDKPRFEAFEHQPAPLVATAAAWADYARQLGAVADGCAVADPLLPPARVIDALQDVQRPTGAVPLPPARLLRLASSAARRAALSSRQELYPRGMSPLQALRQSAGALTGARLTATEVRQRVRGRYPEASALPEGEALHHLLEQAEIPLLWNPAERNFTPQVLTRLTAGSTTAVSRDSWHGQPQGVGQPQGNDAVQAFDARLLASAPDERTAGTPGLLVLTVEPRLARHAEAELLRRFGPDSGRARAFQRLSVDAVLLKALREQAAAVRADWNVVLQADAAERASVAWQRLLQLVKRCEPTLRDALLHQHHPLLLVHCGLLARYDLMGLLGELRDTAGRPGNTPAAWLLLPTQAQGLPRIDGTPVPLLNPHHALAVPPARVPLPHAVAAA